MPVLQARPLLIGFAVLVWLTATVYPASAEWFVDLYAGAAFTQHRDIQVTTQSVLGIPFPTPVPERFSNVSFDTSVSYGGRFGYWFEAIPHLGLALDVFRFEPDVSEQTGTVTVFGTTFPFPLATTDIGVTAISFDLMLRWPLLTSSQFPKGQLQPYFTVGPTIFVVDVHDTTNFGPPFNQSDTDTAVGVKAGVGLAWQFHKNMALFGEYRFTHVSPAVKFRDPGGTTTAETDLNSHHLVTGISFRF